MGKPSTPAAPDYTQAAQQTAQGNLDVAKYTTQANRVNQYSPYGSITYTKTPQAQTFDQAGYDRALADYQKQLAATRSQPIESDGGRITSAANRNRATVNAAQAANLVAPDRANFMKAGDDVWSMNQSLSPEQQKLFDQNQQLNMQLGDVAQQGLGYVRDALGNPLRQDIPLVSSVNQPTLQSSIANNADLLALTAGNPELLQQGVTDALYRQQTQYLDPQFSQRQSDLENQLANQGITRGSEAWNREMQNAALQKQQAYESARGSAIGQGIGAAQGMFGMNLSNAGLRNQALGQQFGQGLQAAQFGNQAGLQGFGMGMQNAQLQNQTAAQNLAQAQALRNDPINMLNAVRSGQQMQVAQMPQMQNVAQMQGVAGPDYMGAAQGNANYNQGMYNAQAAGQNALMSGLFGLGAGYLMGPR